MSARPRPAAARATTVMAVALLPVVSWIAGTRGTLPADRTHADIPVFARLYRTGCSTCHVAAPKLNVLGEAFRLNGYRMPESQLLVRRDDPVPLGNDAWKDEWPRAIWPGSLPGQTPLALRVQSDVQFTRADASAGTVHYRFPHEVYLLAAANFDETFSTFVESEWSPGGGLEVVQAKVTVQDPIPALPARALNVWVGLQNPFLFTFADRQIDRAGRQPFRWQFLPVADLDFTASGTGATLTSENGFRPGASAAAIELNGLLGNRFYYGVGLSQGAAAAPRDNNARKDLYYKVRYKFGGLDLRGAYGPGGEPVLGTGGLLLDRSVIIEHFGYFGAEPVGADRADDRYRMFGVNARVLHGAWDVGGGWVRRWHDRPWGRGTPGDLSLTSVFGKAEVLVRPWLTLSLKAERITAPIPNELAATGFDTGAFGETRINPGLVALLRQNVRGIVEVEWLAADALADAAGTRRPHAVWLRLDLAY